MNKKTIDEYLEVISTCQELFLSKTTDYGTSWRILRLPSLTDQIYIKAQRLRSIQEKGVAKVDEPQSDCFIAIINYCIMAQVQMLLGDNKELSMTNEQIAPLYKRVVEETTHLLTDKNHDYDEAWRDMRISSMTDIILMKLLRLKSIEDHSEVGKELLVSEGVKGNYQDIMNYAVFCMILINEA